MALFLSAPAWAGEVGEFSVLGTGTVVLKKEAKVLSGAVGVNDGNGSLGAAGYELMVKKEVLIEREASLVASRIHIGKESDVNGDVSYRDKLQVDDGAVVSGVVRVLNGAGDWPLAVIAASPECSPDAGRPVAVAKEGSIVLSAGAYGEVSVGKGAEVVLTGGRYDVQSFEVEKEAKIYFDGAVEVCVAGRFYLGKESVIRPAENYDYVLTNMGGGTYRRQGRFGEYDTLVLNADNSAVLTTKTGMKYVFNPDGTLRAIEDTQGNQLVMTYDVGGLLPIIGTLPSSPGPQQVDVDYRLTRIEQAFNNIPSGRYVTLSYNANGRLETLTDFTGRQVRYEYDPSGNGDLIDVIDPAGNHLPYTYDGTHRMLNFEEPNPAGCSGGCSASPTGLHVNTYDAQNRVVRQAHGNNTVDFDYINAPAETKVTTSVYDDTTSALISTRIEYYEYDGSGRMIRWTRQMGSGRDTVSSETDDLARSLAYNAQGWATQRAMEDGTVINYSYDTYGNLLSEMTTKPGEPTIVTGYTYEPATNRIASKLLGSTSDGQVFRTEYDYSAGLITEERRYVDAATALTTSYTYNPQGDVLTAADPNGNILQYEYDANGFMTRVYDPNNPSRQTLFTYDALGTRASVTDANTNTTNFTYDALSRVLTATNAKNEQTINTYTGRNLTEVESGATILPGLITRMYYDSLNRQERVTRLTTTGEVTLNTLRYDSEANVLTAIDANTLATTNSYDVLGRLITTSDPLGNTTSLLPDKAGNEIVGIRDCFLRAWEDGCP